MMQNDGTVWMDTQEGRYEAGDELLPEAAEWGGVLKQAQQENIGAVLDRELEQLNNLK